MKSNAGVSIFSAVFTLLFLGAIGLAVITLFSEESQTAISDTSALQAHYIALGGLERGRGYLELEGDSNWPENGTQPAFTGVALGNGSFTLVSEYAATDLDKSMNDTVTTAETASTSGFASSGLLKIDNEYMTYTGLGTSPTSFTGLTRAQQGSTAVGHNKNKAVLVSTTLSGNITSSATSISVSSTTKFLGNGVTFTISDGGGGTIQIESEEINYAYLSSSSFEGCERGANGTSAASHLAANNPVFPLANSCVMKSTGTVGTAGTITYGQRILIETAKE